MAVCSNHVRGHTPSAGFRQGKRRVLLRTAAAAATRDLTADVLGTVAAIALKARLQSYQEVQASIDCTAWGLARGRVEAVAIRGRQWRSPLGLTAEVVEVNLSEAIINYGTLILQRRVTLQNVPVGSARVVFDKEDFCNFLNHPLMKAASTKAVQGLPFHFDTTTVVLDAFFGPCGSLSLEGTCSRDGHRYRVSMMPADCIPNLKAAATPNSAPPPPPPVPQQRALQVVASRVGGDGSAQSDAAAEKVGEEVARFFTGLCIDLQGVELLYSSMGVTRSSSMEESDRLELILKVRLRDFPPLNVQF